MSYLPRTSISVARYRLNIRLEISTPCSMEHWNKIFTKESLQVTILWLFHLAMMLNIELPIFVLLLPGFLHFLSKLLFQVFSLFIGVMISVKRIRQDDCLYSGIGLCMVSYEYDLLFCSQILALDFNRTLEEYILF